MRYCATVSAKPRPAWECRCECGNLRVVDAGSLRSGNSRSCGCLNAETTAARNRSQRDDLVGRTFGKLTAFEHLEAGTERSYSAERCRCECGAVCVVSSHLLRTGEQTNCAACRPATFVEDLTGREFGDLTVLSRAAKPGRKEREAVSWWCRCRCGHTLTRTVTTNQLTAGIARSCGCHRDADVDKTRFAEITTEADAYWLGFMYTDGCLSTRGYSVRLTLKSTDFGHVEDFARYMGSQKPIYFGTDGKGHKRATFAAGTRVVHSNLVRQGCTPQKTWTITPWVGPSHLMRHFWRGCVDGDGWVAVGKQTHLGLCGNEAMVRGFARFVEEATGKPGCIGLTEPVGKCAREAGCMFARVDWGGRSAAPVAKLLYEGATVALPRKLASAAVAMNPPPRRPAGRPPKRIASGRVKELLSSLGSWNAVAKHLGVGRTTLWRLAYDPRRQIA